MKMIIQYGSGVGAATEQVNGVVCKTIDAGGGTLAALQFIKRNEKYEEWYANAVCLGNIDIAFSVNMYFNMLFYWNHKRRI